MRYVMTEDEAVYMQSYQGHFSRKLAAWAIGRMEVKDAASEKKKRLVTRPLDDVMDILGANGVEVSDECVYDAWYLFHMACADYPRTLTTDKLRSTFVDETLNDPDGSEGDVLACFIAKRQNAGKPVLWERFI